MAKVKKRKSKKKLFGRKANKEIYVSLSSKVHLNFLEGEEALSPSNFEYIITIDGVQVSLLDINGTIVSPIKTSDKIHAERSTPFYLEVRAQLLSSTGSGSIQLKDLTKNKDVFDKPQEFTFPTSSNGGLFLEEVKLP